MVVKFYFVLYHPRPTKKPSEIPEAVTGITLGALGTGCLGGKLIMILLIDNGNGNGSGSDDYHEDDTGYVLHLPGLQLLVGPGEAHGLEALEVGHLPSQPVHPGTVGVGDTGREGFDVPCCRGQTIIVLQVDIASDKGGKESKGKKNGAIHHGHCRHRLPHQSSQLDAIMITIVVYDHLVVIIGPLLGGGGSLTRYLSLISYQLLVSGESNCNSWWEVL